MDQGGLCQKGEDVNVVGVVVLPGVLDLEHHLHRRHSPACHMDVDSGVVDFVDRNVEDLAGRPRDFHQGVGGGKRTRQRGFAGFSQQVTATPAEPAGRQGPAAWSSLSVMRATCTLMSTKTAVISRWPPSASM